ncbi:putative O-methyltransferase YrrM [Herbaspirillum rubrisubalbicans]|uniref:Methyltransferase n=1 Tax=Herbaspirillum rubrisubalbicans Os34 TaxID=1235827 RepID=A0A6M3ZS95_9BURK|nr:class I SAM-dependent methyltransferase [Herbaspirillum rubrisubalbicans]MCP1572648.1 putative O-methyltransferase YrrM [Herbaspirillum rubrisubalbicans]QJQ01241.1 methyltransferase [Herbaspirillum rubrisubalbicans Os34]
MDWNEGYVAGIDYPTGFFREQSPVHLSFACLTHGVEPVALDRPFNYLELGAGQGLTASVLAAANPQGRFYAIDFSPSHVQSARELAQAAELDNLCVLEHSFAELAAGLVDLPPMDFITMYGVYSWVDAGNRKHIVDLIARYLKPGGIVYLNYNAMPGWSPSLPLQRLILERTQTDRHATHEQLGQAREMVQQLQALGATFFDGNPNLQYRLDSLRNDKGGYLAHEYMSDGWMPLYHADVARAMAGAKMDYIGSGELAQAFPRLYLTPQQQALLDTVDDPMLRETVKDYMTNTSFREDIYIRGARRMSTTRREHWLRQIGLALTSLPDMLTLELDLSIGKVKADPRYYQPVLDALVRRPHSLVELAEIPALFPLSLEDIGQMAALLTASGQACAYFLSAAELPVAPAQRLNAALAEASRFKDHYQVLASPLLGNGLAAGLIQRLLFRQLRRPSDRLDLQQCVQQMHDVLQAQQQPLFREGRVLQTQEEVLGELHHLTEAIVTRRVPIWRTLNML